LELGASPNRVEQPQKILVLVFSWTWTSKPITGSYFASISAEIALSSGVVFAMVERKL
jgi:hypothetical protein